MSSTKFPTKRIFQNVHILKINRMMSFWNYPRTWRFVFSCDHALSFGILVRHFHVLHFHALLFGPPFSFPAISCPARLLWSVNFMSVIFSALGIAQQKRVRILFLHTVLLYRLHSNHSVLGTQGCCYRISFHCGRKAQNNLTTFKKYRIVQQNCPSISQAARTWGIK